MKIAFLEPVEGIARELLAQHFDTADVLIAPNKEELPAALAEAEVIVWSDWPVDAALIESLPKLRLLQRLGRVRARGDVSAALERRLPVSVLPHGTSGRVGEHVSAALSPRRNR
jgi:D-3-phosphoglycerate dehydrogenase